MRVCEMCRQDPKVAAGGRSSTKALGETGPDRHPKNPTLFLHQHSSQVRTEKKAPKTCSPPELGNRGKEEDKKESAG